MMTSIEAEQFIANEIESMWESWKPNKSEMNIWIYELRKYSKESLLSAIKEHYIENSLRRKPNLKSVIILAQNKSPHTSTADKPKPKDRGFYVLCLKGEGVGRFFPILCGGLEEKHDDNYYLRQGQFWVNKFATEKKEEWIIIQGASHFDMMKKRTELRKIA